MAAARHYLFHARQKGEARDELVKALHDAVEGASGAAMTVTDMAAESEPEWMFSLAPPDSAAEDLPLCEVHVEEGDGPVSYFVELHAAPVQSPYGMSLSMISGCFVPGASAIIASAAGIALLPWSVFFNAVAAAVVGLGTLWITVVAADLAIRRPAPELTEPHREAFRLKLFAHLEHDDRFEPDRDLLPTGTPDV